MSSKIASYRLGDLTDWLSGGTPSKKNPEYWGDEIPWISASSMGGSRYSNSDLKITKKGLDAGSRLALEGSILLLVRGSTLHNRIPVGIAERDVAFNQDVKAIRVKPELIARQVTDEMYVYYWLKANEQRLLEMVEHTGIGAGKLDTKRLQNLEIRLPSWPEQRQIVASATAIDEKEILNSRINQTLEQMAQAIFKSWFVDFDPVKAKIAALEGGGSEEDALLAAMQTISGKGEEELTRLQAEQPEQYAELRATAELFPSAMQDSELGEIPEGWSVTSVNEIAEIVKGKSYKSAELEPSQTALVTLKSFKRGGGYRLDGLKEYTGKYNPQQEVTAGDLIIAYTDVTQAADVIGKPAMIIADERYEHLVISLDVAVIRPIDASLKPFLYGLAKTDAFQFHTRAYTTGTTVLHLAKDAVPEYELALPTKGLINSYAAHANPLFTLINKKVQENRSLESLRDTLLPKLLSGELSISDAEDQLKEVAVPTNV